MSAATLATLITIALIAVPDHAASGGLAQADLEPHLRGAAQPAAGGLNRQMKRERAGRMADREDRRLAWLARRS